MTFRTGRRAVFLAATCLTPFAAHALEIGADPSAVAGVSPGMSYQEFHTALSEQGFTMIPGTSVTPGANSDILSDDTMVASVYGYGADGGARIIQVETGADGQGDRVAFRVTGIYSLDAEATDFDRLDADFDAKFGTEPSCIDPAIGAVFQYDESLHLVETPNCAVSQPLLQPMPRELVERTLGGDGWPFTATGGKAIYQEGEVTLIESVQDNRLAAEVHAVALGLDLPETQPPAETRPAPADTEAAPAATVPQAGSIDGFISIGKLGPMPAFLGLEFGMPLGDALAALKADGFEFREDFVPEAYLMRLYSDPIFYDTTMDIAFMPYAQKIVQELQLDDPSIRFKGFLAHRRNDDGSTDTVGGDIVQGADYKGIDRDAPLLRLRVSRDFGRARALPIMDWLEAIRTPGQKFEGGCISNRPEGVKLFTKDGKITGRPHDDANGCMEWELVHEHRYRALVVEDRIQDPSVVGSQRLRKIEVLIDDHQAIEEALRR